MSLINRLIKSLIIIKLLVLKNWKIRFHHKISFLLLFLIPICFTIFAVWLTSGEHRYYSDYGSGEPNRTVVEQINYNSTPIFQPFETYYESMDRYSLIGIVYYPNNSYTNQLMPRVVNILNAKFANLTNFTSIPVNTENEFNNIFADNRRQYDSDYDSESIK